MSTRHPSSSLILQPADARRLANLCGQFDQHLRQVERRFQVDILNRGNVFYLTGEAQRVHAAGLALKGIYEAADRELLTPDRVHLMLSENELLHEVEAAPEVDAQAEVVIQTRRKLIKGRTPNQKRYLKNILAHDLNFGVGPAGTGKTYLAVACAVDALESERVRRLVLVRPAVEAGERLGFLPGDLAQKIDPYLRPLYDALHEMLGFERVAKLIERSVIEVAPLAYMRGRTLNDSFIILDEAQNTTAEQMKMLLTRMGFNSTVVVTGDVTQVDLPTDRVSGLQQALTVLQDVPDISVTRFGGRDVVRHPLVQQVVNAYAAYEQPAAPESDPDA